MNVKLYIKPLLLLVMAIFKKNDEVYDYTLLQRKGFLKKEEEKKPLGKVTKDGYFELGSNESVEVKTETPTASSGSVNFFENFAPTTTAAEPSPLASFDSVFPSAPSIPSAQNVDAQDLAVKIDDFEYKLNRISDKLAEIEEKLSRFEDRVS